MEERTCLVLLRGNKKKLKWPDQVKTVKGIQSYVFKHYKRKIYFNIFLCVLNAHIITFSISIIFSIKEAIITGKHEFWHKKY